MTERRVIRQKFQNFVQSKMNNLHVSACQQNSCVIVKFNAILGVLTIYAN